MGLTSLLLALPGCPLSPDSDDDRKKVDDIRLDRSSVPGTIEYVADVWSHKLYEEYEMVLHDQFEFFPKAGDAQDLPWLVGQSWPRTVELEMAAHMFDPNFDSPNAEPVQSIEMDFNILSTTAVEDTIRVDCTSTVLVLVGPDTGFFSDTRFVFDIVADPDEPGLFQVIRQEEVERQ